MTESQYLTRQSLLVHLERLVQDAQFPRWLVKGKDMSIVANRNAFHRPVRNLQYSGR